MNEVILMISSNESIEKLADIFRNRQPIVFFGGAGTSTESSIPDFRSKDGLYSTRFRDLDPEYLLSHDCMMQQPDVFYEYLKSKLYYPDAVPNRTHDVLVRLEQRGILKAVITQNIDGLHQAAGSLNVIELHGSMTRSSCIRCGTPYPGAAMFTSETMVPHCLKCDGMLRPDVTLYGESLDSEVVESAISAISAADVLIVGGTSLAVYPAASFLSYFTGSTLVLMNRDATPIDRKASLIIREPIGISMGQAYELAFGESLQINGSHP